MVMSSILFVCSITFLCISPFILLQIFIEIISILICLIILIIHLIIIFIICGCCIIICYIIIFIPTQLIEGELVLLCHISTYLCVLYLICSSFTVFFIPLCFTNPFITYLASRYCHFLGFKWSKLFNSLFSIPAFIVDIFWSFMEFIFN